MVASDLFQSCDAFTISTMVSTCALHAYGLFSVFAQSFRDQTRDIDRYHRSCPTHTQTQFSQSSRVRGTVRRLELRPSIDRRAAPTRGDADRTGARRTAGLLYPARFCKEWAVVAVDARGERGAPYGYALRGAGAEPARSALQQRAWGMSGPVRI